MVGESMKRRPGPHGPGPDGCRPVMRKRCVAGTCRGHGGTGGRGPWQGDPGGSVPSGLRGSQGRPTGFGTVAAGGGVSALGWAGATPPGGWRERGASWLGGGLGGGGRRRKFEVGGENVGKRRGRLGEGVETRQLA
ncbi:uncharacterized protein N7529_002114 [Penicillium soppii]|uniref:uncharacterized protein n=1 Tax=Penicillium soppii TaxID=69789 RepID=UPI00254884B1|nr:uncharacterized protein N7529_002114 [Penicillium soppii]KAJ5876530.1 hypothetical protein N7529_002114 [Penicillium soppii]